MKYKFIRQHSEEDCGAACLAMIAKYHGRTFTISRMREVIGTGQQGTTLLGLRQGAESLGYNARPVRTSEDILNRMKEAPLPAVIHWMGYHWVVLYGKRGNKYVVADPGVGIRYLTKEQLKAGWIDWVMLLLEPDQARLFAEESDQPKSGFWRFVKRVFPYRGILIEAFICAVIVGILSLSSPFLMQILTDDVLVRGDTKLLMAVAIAVVVMNLITSLLSLVQSNLVAHFAQRLQLGLVLEFGRQILRLPLSYYESRRSGEVVSRLQDIQEINQLVSQLVVSLPTQIFIGLSSLAFMLFYSSSLTLAAIVVGLLMSLSTVIFMPTLQNKIRNTLVLDAENQGVLVETFKGALTMKATTAAPQFWDEFQSRFSRLATQSLSTTQIGIFNNVFSRFVSDSGAVGLLWLGSTLVIGQELSIGQLMAFNGMTRNFFGLITAVIGFSNEFARVKTSVNRLGEVIDATPEEIDGQHKAVVYIGDRTDIHCTNLDFHYAGRMDLLDDFSLTMPGGQVIALVGKSGCGKSTLTKLLAGLYPVQSGNIRLGKYNIQDISTESLRKQIILVPQDSQFWSRSIIENFRMGSPEIPLEKIVTACQISGADEFISKFPEKYFTVLGEFGTNMSGGQRQRLAIARALVHEPPILILDESTSGLDPVSESEVLDRLLAAREGKTTILISHRPRVINRADWLVMLEQGRLKIFGAIAELYSIPGDHLDFLIEDTKQIGQVKADAFYKQGMSRLTIGDGQTAIALFTGALQHQAEHVKAYFSRGLAKFSMRDDLGAMADFNRALEIQPNYAEVYLSRGMLYRRLGDRMAAIADANRAAKLSLDQRHMSNYRRALDLIDRLSGKGRKGRSVSS
jgi:ATP-binding cassette, subfamily C, bacterial